MRMLPRSFSILFMLMAVCAPLAAHAQEIWMNIFIHGIISIKPHITVTNFLRFLTDNVKDSVYAETVLAMRDDPFFYQNQCMQGRGLIPINPEPSYKKGDAANLLVQAWENVAESQNPASNRYYTYGWSGLLSRSERYQDAKNCIQAIEAEIAALRAQGLSPKIRVVGYSHGGTVLLKMALVKRNERLHPTFTIDEAILIGTPIQMDTDYLITDPLFKKVYNIFSRGDRVQKLDFFSCGEFFSEHLFWPHCGFEELPEKLTQIEVRVIRKRGEATSCIEQATTRSPLLYDGHRCSRLVRNVSPGHMELWFFGWTPRHYRSTFPLYPLPIVCFLPYIRDCVNALEPSNPKSPFVVTIDPRRDSMIIKNNALTPKSYRLPFIGAEKLKELQNEAHLYEPDKENYNQDVYRKHIEQAFEKAHAILKEKKGKKISPVFLVTPAT